MDTYKQTDPLADVESTGKLYNEDNIGLLNCEFGEAINDEEDLNTPKSIPMEDRNQLAPNLECIKVIGID